MSAQTLTSLPGRAGAERRGPSLIETLRRAWRNYFAYCETLAALRAKSVRELEDIGLAGEDLQAVAREAVWGPR